VHIDPEGLKTAKDCACNYRKDLDRCNQEAKGTLYEFVVGEAVGSAVGNAALGAASGGAVGTAACPGAGTLAGGVMGAMSGAIVGALGGSISGAISASGEYKRCVARAEEDLEGCIDEVRRERGLSPRPR